MPSGAAAGSSGGAVPRLFAESSTEPHDERILPEGVEAGQTAARGPFYLADVEREQYLRIVFNADPYAPKTWMFTRLTEQQQISQGLDQTRKPIEWTQDQLVHVEYVRPDLPDSGVDLGPVMAILDATATAAGRWFNQWYAAAMQSAAQGLGRLTAGALSGGLFAGIGSQVTTTSSPTGAATEWFDPSTGQFHFAATPNVGEWVIDESRLDACAQKAGAAPSVRSMSALPHLSKSRPLWLLDADPVTQAQWVYQRAWDRYDFWGWQVDDYAGRLLDAARKMNLSVEETDALFQKYLSPLLREDDTVLWQDIVAAAAELDHHLASQAATASGPTGQQRVGWTRLTDKELSTFGFSARQLELEYFESPDAVFKKLGLTEDDWASGRWGLVVEKGSRRPVVDPDSGRPLEIYVVTNARTGQVWYCVQLKVHSRDGRYDVIGWQCFTDKEEYFARVKAYDSLRLWTQFAIPVVSMLPAPSVPVPAGPPTPARPPQPCVTSQPSRSPSSKTSGTAIQNPGKYILSADHQLIVIQQGKSGFVHHWVRMSRANYQVWAAARADRISLLAKLGTSREFNFASMGRWYEAWWQNYRITRNALQATEAANKLPF